MASSIRLTNTGAPDTPPAGYARIYVEDFGDKLYLKMKRPDGSVQVFGTINLPIEAQAGGTGLTEIPGIGQFLIGTGAGYRIGDIVAGPGINIVKSETSFEISTDISNIELQMPSEFIVNEQSSGGQNTFVVTKSSQNQNTVYAGPSASNGLPTFRFLQVEDIPNLPITKIINLIETIRAESLLVPVDSADIDHTYDSTAKTLSSIIKPTSVTSGSYGSSTSVTSITVRPDGRLSAASNIPIAIPHTQVTNFIEAAQDAVGALATNSISINAEYNDYNNFLKFHVNEEHLITTNISSSENTRAPTSQAIKQYVDDLTNAERAARITQDTELQAAITELETQVGSNLQQIISDLNSALQTETNLRIAEDIAINQRLNNFFQNAPTILDTITEIAQRFEAIEETIRDGLSVQTQTLSDEIGVINAHLDVIRSDINAEVDTRIIEIDRVYNAITAHREKIDLTPALLNVAIPLTQVQQLSHIMPNSVVAFIDRLGIFEGFDFNLSTNNGQVVLNFTSEILDILDGSEVLRISYLTKI